MILRHFGGKLGLKWGFGEFYKSGFAERKFHLVPPPPLINVQTCTWPDCMFSL